MVLAEFESLKDAVGMIVAALIGGGLFKVADWFRQYRKDQKTEGNADKDKARKEKQEDEDREIGRLERYIARLEVELKATRQELHDVRDSAQTWAIKAERRAVWIRGIEAILEQHEIEFPKWTNGQTELARSPEDTPDR